MDIGRASQSNDDERGQMAQQTSDCKMKKSNIYFSLLSFESRLLAEEGPIAGEGKGGNAIPGLSEGEAIEPSKSKSFSPNPSPLEVALSAPQISNPYVRHDE